MIGSTGLMAGVAAKVLLALGVGAAGVTATGAAGALPGPAQQVVSGVVNSVSPLHIPTGTAHVTGGGAVTAGPSAGAGLRGPNAVAGATEAKAGVATPVGSANATAGGPASGTAGTAGASAGVSGSVGTKAGIVPPTLPPVPVPKVPTIPGLPTGAVPGVGSLPTQLPSCVTSIVDPSTAKLLVPPAQLSSKVLACVQSLVPAGTLPSSVTSCLTSVLGSLQGLLGGGVPTGVPSINVSACVPLDVSKCVSSVVGAVGANPLALLGNLASLGNLANLTNLTGLLNLGNLGSLANLGNLSGCVPVDATRCVTSILGSVTSAGSLGAGVPKLDLSSCLPTGLPAVLPIAH